MGVRIVRLVESPEGSTPQWATDIVLETRGDRQLQLIDPDFVSARFSPDLGLLVANVSELVYLQPSGGEGMLLAGPGDGPNDFRTISHLGVSAQGSPFVLELMGQRLSRIDWNAKRVTQGGRLPLGDDRGPPLAITLLSDSIIIGVPSQVKPNRGTAGGYPIGENRVRDSIVLSSYSLLDGSPVQLLGVWPGVERASGFIVPFTPGVVFGSRGSATVIGVTDSLDLFLFDGTRTTLRIIEQSRRRPPSGEDRTAWNQAVAEEIDPAIVAMFDGIPGPKMLPEIGAYVVDNVGNIWVGDYAVPGQTSRRWRIFGPRGALLGALELPVLQSAYFPSRSELLDVVEDRIALLREAPDGSLYIEVRRVRR